MPKPLSLLPRILIRLMIVSLVAIAGWLLGHRLAPVSPHIGSRAVAPLAMPAAGELDCRVNLPAVWQMAAIPRALRFDLPMGTEHGGLTYDAQPFWEMNTKRGGRHLGDDWNGIGGMNTDLGDPLFAVADGLVQYAGEPSPGWGNVIILAHAVADGRTLTSMYAHLERRAVRVGELVARGQTIGTVGTANGYYPAHLHFEMRDSNGVDIGGGYALDRLNRLDPTATVATLRHAAADDLAPSPLARVLGRPPPPGH